MKNRVFSEFLKYSTLNILGMLGLSCYILADTYFVQKGMGGTGLAALNLAIPVFNVVNGIGLMIGVGGATGFSISKGCNNDANGNSFFKYSVCLCILFSFVFIFAGIFLSSNIAMLLGADSDTLKMCSTYIKVILLFSPMFIFNNIMQAFVRNDSNPRLSMMAMLLGSFSNVILDYIFIFPMKMGIFGAALATGIAPIIGITVTSFHFIKKKNTFTLNFKKSKIKYVFNILSAGFSSFITELSSAIVIIIFNLIILRLNGNIGVAAYGIIANLSLVVISVYTGIAQGVQPLFSSYHGANDRGNNRQILKYSVLMVIIISLTIYFFIIMFAEQITSVFNSENNLMLAQTANKGLRIYFSGCIFAGLNIILASYFAATEKTVYSSLVSLLRGIVLIIPTAFLMSHLFLADGLWFSFCVTELITSIIAIFMIKNKTDLIKMKSI